VRMSTRPVRYEEAERRIAAFNISTQTPPTVCPTPPPPSTIICCPFCFLLFQLSLYLSGGGGSYEPIISLRQHVVSSEDFGVIDLWDGPGY